MFVFCVPRHDWIVQTFEIDFPGENIGDQSEVVLFFPDRSRALIKATMVEKFPTGGSFEIEYTITHPSRKTIHKVSKAEIGVLGNRFPKSVTGRRMWDYLAIAWHDIGSQNLDPNSEQTPYRLGKLDEHGALMTVSSANVFSGRKIA